MTQIACLRIAAVKKCRSLQTNTIQIDSAGTARSFHKVFHRFCGTRRGGLQALAHTVRGLQPVAGGRFVLKKQRLFTPGPTPLHPVVQEAMARPILHHRTDEFRAVFRDCAAGLKAFLKAA